MIVMSYGGEKSRDVGRVEEEGAAPAPLLSGSCCHRDPPVTRFAKEMEVYAIVGSGGPTALQRQVQQIPTAKDDEVIIQVLEVSVNKLDILRTYQSVDMLDHWSDIPGLECCGIITHLGAGAHRFKIGDEVCALLDGGGYAEYVVVPEDQVLPRVPKFAACIPHAACMAWEALSRLGKLSEGMSLLVFASCGATCDLAIHLANSVKAKVVVATTDIKLNTLQYFPNRVLDVNDLNFPKLAVEETSKREGFDIVLDSGISNFENTKMYLKNGGTIILVDAVAKKKANMGYSLLFNFNATLHVIDRRSWTREYTAEVVREVREQLWPTLDKFVHPIFPTSFPLSNVVEAHQFIEERDLNRAILRL